MYNGIRTIQEKLDFKQQNLKYRIDESEKKENKENSLEISNFHFLYLSSYKSSDNVKREISMRILNYLNNKCM